MLPSTPEVVAAVIIEDGKIWLLDHDPAGREKRPFHLENQRHDGKPAEAVMNAHLEERFGLTNLTPKLLERRLMTSDDNKPVMYLTGLVYHLDGQTDTKSVDGITLNKVAPKKLDQYNIFHMYREFVDQAIDGDETD